MTSRHDMTRDDYFERLSPGQVLFSDGHGIRLESRVLLLGDIPDLSYEELEECRDEMLDIFYQQDRIGQHCINLLIVLNAEISRRDAEDSN